MGFLLPAALLAGTSPALPPPRCHHGAALPFAKPDPGERFSKAARRQIGGPPAGVPIGQRHRDQVDPPVGRLGATVTYDVVVPVRGWARRFRRCGCNLPAQSKRFGLGQDGLILCFPVLVRRPGLPVPMVKLGTPRRSLRYGRGRPSKAFVLPLSWQPPVSLCIQYCSSWPSRAKGA